VRLAEKLRLNFVIGSFCFLGFMHESH